MYNVIKLIRGWFYRIKRSRAIKNRIKELRKRDPFIYK